MTFGSLIRIFCRCGLLLLCLGVMLAGCSRQDSSATTPKDLSYGQISMPALTNMARVRPVGAPFDDNWRKEPFWVLQTELSPFTVFHSSSNYLGFFTGLTNSGRGAPAYVAYVSNGGQKVFRNGDAMDVSTMGECWVLVWFAGARGWTNWDSPWVVFLQNKPSRLWLDDSGLHFQFKQQAGNAVLMPFYGFERMSLKDKPLAKARIPAREGSIRQRPVQTWEWSQVVSQDALMRVRYWAGMSRCIPVYCEDTFSVDRGHDSVTIRQRFEWLKIEDEWGTRPLKVAPLSPVLGLAVKEKGFPVEFSRQPMDYDLFTPYGPYFGIEGVESYDATFPLLKYVNEAEVSGAPTNTHPSVAAALEKLQKTIHEKFPTSSPILKENLWPMLENQWYSKALPYLAEPTRSNVVVKLRRHLSGDVLRRLQLRELEFGGINRHELDLREYNHGQWRTVFRTDSPLTYENLWLEFLSSLNSPIEAFGEATGDWDLIRTNWTAIRTNLLRGTRTGWATFGREEIAEKGAQAGPCLALARMAYQVGDMETYNYASYLFVRQLVNHFARQRGTAYFRERQPLNDEVYLGEIQNDYGWFSEGSTNSNGTADWTYFSRWARFNDADVGRFYRDFLQTEVRREMDLWTTRLDSKQRAESIPHLTPSMVQLRSLLLNEPPEKLAVVATPAEFTGTDAGIIASCLSVLRVSGPLHYQRVIPTGEASAFSLGAEREATIASAPLMGKIRYWDEPSMASPLEFHWPRVISGRDTFGDVSMVRDGKGPKSTLIPLNWNTQVRVLTMK